MKMKKERKNILSENFFETERKIISSKEALADVTPVNWKEYLKHNNENSVINFKKMKKGNI